MRFRPQVPVSATPSEVDRESVQEKEWVPELIVTSSKKAPNPTSN